MQCLLGDEICALERALRLRVPHTDGQVPLRPLDCRWWGGVCAGCRLALPLAF